MKKWIIALFLILLCMGGLTGCLFDYTEYPDMVEYKEEQILEVIKEKYDIESFIFTSSKFNGELDTTTDFGLDFVFHDPLYSSDFINPVNMERALTSFAGKNGNHDIQGMYSIFLCYVALGVNSNNEAKFIYYNTNIHKDAEIADTIGVSDYPYDILPNEISEYIYSADNNRVEMNQFLSTIKNAPYIYSKEYLSKSIDLNNYNGDVEVRYYKEGDKVVYDVYYSERRNSSNVSYEEPKLCYSTSERYGVIYNYYGFDYSPYIDVSYSVEPSTELTSCDLIKGSAKLKDFGKVVIYSQLSVNISYYKLHGESITEYVSATGIKRDTSEVTHGVLADKLDGVSHKDTAKFFLSDFYILYEK